MKLFIRYLTNFILYFILVFFLVFYFLFFLNLRNEGENLAKKIELVVFLKDGLSSEIIAQLGENLRQTKNVKDVFYTSKDEALKQLLGNPVIKEGVTLLKENPLPASFTVYPQSFEEKEISELREHLSSLSGVEKVIFNEEIFNRYLWLEALYKRLDIFNLIFLGLFFILLIFTVGYLFLSPNKKEMIFTYFRQILLSFSATGAILFLFYEIKLRFLKTIIFFNLKEIIFLLAGILIFTFFLSVFLFEKNE
jgi:hypothetical protein